MEYALYAAVPYGKNDVYESTIKDTLERANFFLGAVLDDAFISTQKDEQVFRTTLLTKIKSSFKKKNLEKESTFFAGVYRSIFVGLKMTPWDRLRCMVTAMLFLRILMTEDARQNVRLSSIALIMCRAIILRMQLKEISGVVETFDVWRNTVKGLLPVFAGLHHRVFYTEPHEIESVGRDNYKGSV